MLLHFVSCDWHCGWTPAEYAANAVYLQWGLQTYPKNGQLLLFPKRWTVRQRIFGKTENEICCATTGLMKHQPRKNWSVWFRQSFGLTNKAKHNPPICNCVFWYRMFYPPPHVTCSKSFHLRCPVQSTRQASVTISVCPDWGQIPDCHSGKAHYRSIRFCGLTIPLTTE